MSVSSPADINECNPQIGPAGKCGENAICTNTIGSFTCQCRMGFSGNPYTICIGESPNARIRMAFGSLMNHPTKNY